MDQMLLPVTCRRSGDILAVPALEPASPHMRTTFAGTASAPATGTMPAGAGPVPLVYLLAASHSGSTLLAMLLGSHPDVCTVGELKATSLGSVDTYRCSCGAPIRQCEFWTGITSAMAARGIAFDIGRAGTDLRSGASGYVTRLLKPLHRGPGLEMLRDIALNLSPGWKEHLRRVDAANAALVSCIKERTGARVIVDSSKIGIRLKYLLRNPAFDVKVVRVVRDGRAVALTYMDPERFADAKDPRLRGGGAGAPRDAERLPLTQAAREWRRSNEEAEALLSTLDRSRWMEVRYESVCGATSDTLDRVFAFAGVEPGRAPKDFRSVVQHVIGNGMRLDTSSEIRLDDRWRSTFTESDLREFDAVAGDLNRRLGYTT
jgi:hypothetical protein